MSDYKRLRELAMAATPGPWCYESCGEKGDGANIIGVAFGPDDERCEHPLSGQLEEWTEDGKEIEYYRDEEVAVCEHRNRGAESNAAFIAAVNPQTILALLDALDAAEQPAPDDARLELEWLWANCHIVYWPKGDPQPYPIEHNLRASKNSRDLIEAAIAEQAQERTP